MPPERTNLVVKQLRHYIGNRFGISLRIFCAPGRVNLIGEHTDYNDGFVMPAALEFYTYVAIAPRNDRQVHVYSLDFQESREFNLDAMAPGPSGDWSNYVRGVAAALEGAGHRVSGANLVIKGEVPVGAGLSSSAAIEVSSALAFLANSGIELDRAQVARLCQQAEHEYAGTKCGIMDQFIACFGRANHALLLDCRSLTYNPLKLDEQLHIVICNTKVKHELVSGEYNLRRAECEAGVRYLQERLPGIRALRDVTLDEFERYGGSMPEVTFRRCRHVISENERVLAAAQALQSADLSEFGQLMAESHRSLRDDYEVSCAELDFMVKIAQRLPGVFGARLTGGGFGGCTVNLVSADVVEGFRKTVAREYQAATGLRPDIYICTAADRAAEVHDGVQ
jgi:galactokinase